MITILFDTGYELKIELEENSFVQRWRQLFQKELACKEILQVDTFSSFYNEVESRQHLTDSIEKVNVFLKTTFIQIPTDEDFNNPDYYNFLHTRFEKLAGPDWEKPTKLMTIAPKEIRLAIRHINRFCHRLELRPYKIEPLMRVEFDSTCREILFDQDYKLFESMYEKDRVYLDYSTLGKSLYACYKDGLDPSYAALKLQRHYCASFVIIFDQFITRPKNESFEVWLDKHNIDKSIQGSGVIPIGKIVSNSFESVIKSRRIEKITLD